MKNEIRIGNIVQVDFNNAQFTLCDRAEVLHIPQDVGDSWHFRNCVTGQIFYISEGCTLSKLLSTPDDFLEPVEAPHD